ncbi:cytidine deaminase [Phascolarctobacterium sp.]|uniref:cytidine deaminase n=1 Tax=Phascolarctobacterium sp. TaxID=2049039 RepID=UPI00386BA411
MQDLRIEAASLAVQELYHAAVATRENSYSPYSHFAVGAAVRTAAGKIYGGCNIENASYGLCCCGERNAIFAAVGAGERQLTALCVVADTSAPVSPCGACRQVMSEFNINEIILGNLKGDLKICTLADLLPYGFAL